MSAEIDPGASATLCDDMRMQQVVWNLLSNAIKFTPRGRTVRVGLDREESYTRIVVSDDGQGIDQELLPHVFDRFRQADSSTRRSCGARQRCVWMEYASWWWMMKPTDGD